MKYLLISFKPLYKKLATIILIARIGSKDLERNCYSQNMIVKNRIQIIQFHLE